MGQIGVPGKVEGLPVDYGFGSIAFLNGRLFVTEEQVGGVLRMDSNGENMRFFDNLPRTKCMAFLPDAEHWLCVHEDENWEGRGWNLEHSDVVAHSSEFEFVSKLDVPSMLSFYANSVAVGEGTTLIVATAGELALIDLRTMDKVFDVSLDDVEREQIGCVACAPGNVIVLHDPVPLPPNKPSIRLYNSASGALIRSFRVDASKGEGNTRGMAVWKLK